MEKSPKAAKAADTCETKHFVFWASTKCQQHCKRLFHWPTANSAYSLDPSWGKQKSHAAALKVGTRRLAVSINNDCHSRFRRYCQQCTSDTAQKVCAPMSVSTKNRSFQVYRTNRQSQMTPTRGNWQSGKQRTQHIKMAWNVSLENGMALSVRRPPTPATGSNREGSSPGATQLMSRHISCISGTSKCTVNQWQHGPRGLAWPCHDTAPPLLLRLCGAMALPWARPGPTMAKAMRVILPHHWRSNHPFIREKNNWDLQDLRFLRWPIFCFRSKSHS